MIPTLLLAATLAFAPGAAPSALAPGALRLAGPAPAAALALQEPWDDERWAEPEEREPPHLLVSAWAGEAFAGGGSGRSSAFWAGEAAWVFPSLDLGVQFAQYRALRDATRSWTPVVLTRITQRFMTRRGLEAAFSLGFGAGRPDGWIGWYQVAIGMRVPLGALFLGGELAFEQYDIIRLGGGLGVAF